MTHPTCSTMGAKIVLHDDGTRFMCLDCGATADRTRTNPYPEVKHRRRKCKTVKP